MEKKITSHDKKLEIESLKEKRELVDKEYQELCKERYVEIKVIEDKYEIGMSEFNEKLGAYKTKIHDANMEMHELARQEEWAEAVNRGVLNEFYFAAMLKRCKKSANVDDIKIKQTLKNGIDVWMIINDDYNPYKIYLAFYKGTLVGTSYRETSKHAGDPTTPFSFIGQFEEPLQMKKVFTAGEVYYENATFTAWIKELKKIDVDCATLLQMNDDTLDEISDGMNKWWSEYSWEDKAKELNQQ